MSAPAREAMNDDSTGSRASRRRSRGGSGRGSGGRSGGTPTIRLVLAGVGTLGAILLIVSEFLPLYRVLVGALETEQRSETGWKNHAFAMLLLGLASIPMILGALRGARPAMWALAGIGVVAILIALTVDLPAAQESGTLRESVTYEDAKAEPAAGFFAETLGGVLLLFTGGLMLLLSPRSSEDDERNAI
jgi:hypothetical protein